MQWQVDSEVATGAKCVLVAGKESDPDYDDSHVPGVSTQLYLQNAIQAVASPEAIDRMGGSSPAFRDTLLRLLRLVRPVSFS